ncbi:MAG: hypothetical protein FWG49_01415 [Leptospirales bacterium]|nr:hypothetical protein [Leptospirales bacterium]
MVSFRVKLFLHKGLNDVIFRMPYRFCKRDFNVKKILLLYFILMLSLAALHGQSANKLLIRGLKIFTEDEIYLNLNLKRFAAGELSVSEVISEIENFYKEKGYLLVKVYLISDESNENCEIFVDEGRIGKIVIHGLPTYNVFRFKRVIDIPENIFNSGVMDKNLENLHEKFPQSNIRIDVKKVNDYKYSIIQIDRMFRRLGALVSIDTNFTVLYSAQNDLHFFVEDRVDDSEEENSQNKKGGKFGFKIHFNFPTTVIPQVLYERNQLFFERDHLSSVFSVGYDFGFTKLISTSPAFLEAMPHEMTFAELKYEYKVNLVNIDYFGPLINGTMYRSHTSRKDLGIVRFDYSYVRAVLAPEFTLFNYFNVYAGLGNELLYISNSMFNDAAERYLYVKDHGVYSNFTEVRLKFDPIKINIGNKLDRYVILIYDSYFYGSDFNKLELNSIFETEFDNFSILSLSLKGFKLFGKPQFYRSEEVDDKYFLGFTGKDYYTNSKVSVSSEYRFSIYRDFFYIGAFFDTIIFKPEGYIISGTKFGLGYGPTIRILVYDQYEFIVYYGFDVLYPDKQRGTNLNLKFSRRL